MPGEMTISFSVPQKRHVLPEELGLGWLLLLLWVLALLFNCPAYSLKSILMPYSTAEARAERAPSLTIA